MAEFDLVVRGGNLADGTGSAIREADVARPEAAPEEVLAPHSNLREGCDASRQAESCRLGRGTELPNGMVRQFEPQVAAGHGGKASQHGPAGQ